MAASSKPRRPLVDTSPIVFSNPGITVKPGKIPSDLAPDGDLILDPFGCIYCFVCKVRVPTGPNNSTQHLGGKKHESNNKRFSSPEEKLAVRTSYAKAAFEQRLRMSQSEPEHPNSAPAPSPAPTVATVDHTPASNADLPPKATPQPSPSPPSQNTRSRSQTQTQTQTQLPATEIESGLDDEPILPSSVQRIKRTKQLELAKKYEETTIDKHAFLNSLMSDDEADSPMELEKSNSLEQQPGKDASQNKSTSPSLDIDERTKPFGPLNFNPDPFPVSFEEMNADETLQTDTSANIRKLLSSTPTPKKMAKSAVMQSGSGVNTSDAETNSGSRRKKEKNEGEFISIASTSKKESEGEEEGAVAGSEIPPESLIILKDRNGEELPSWLLDSESTQNVLYSGDSSIALHFEILQFTQFMSPTKEEEQSRDGMVQSVETIVKQLWPESTVSVFGSYATGICLPTSDIDICVMGTPKNGEFDEFEQLAAAIRNVRGFARRVHVIKAKVPLVKIIARDSGINCDICIGRSNGPKNVPVIKEYLAAYPALRPLILVVKCFLQQRDLNETYSGGLGSYTLLLFVVSHLQMLKYNFPNSKANLGAVLQTFFQFYGRMFNLCLAGIRVKDNGCYFDKFEKYKTIPSEILRFSVEDPNDETNELGRNGYAASRVRKAFNNASNTLINWRRDDSLAAPTPLGAILHCDIKLQLRRKDVIEDMEAKSLQPLRDSLNELESGKRKALSGGNNQADAITENDVNTGSNDIPSSSGQLLPRSHESRRHERVNRKRDPTLGERKGRDKEFRDRDPRLAKRRRPSYEIDNGRASDEMAGPNYIAPTAATGTIPLSDRRLNMAGNNQNYPIQPMRQELGSMGYNNVGDANMYGESGYGHQGAYGGEYGAAPYQASTPGYQYIDPQTNLVPDAMPAAIYDASGYVGGPANAMQHMTPGYGQEMHGSGMRRARPGRKRNSYRSRSSYRGR